MSAQFDIAIIGAGPAGGTLAALLAGAGWRVALIEKAAFPRRKVCGEFMSATNRPVFERLGLAEAIAAASGPAVRRVGFFARDVVLAAPMPRGTQGGAWGRALGREHLDALIAKRAEALGAVLFQPFAVTALSGGAGDFVLRLDAGADRRDIGARLVVAAHGSWEPGDLPSQAARPAPRRGDLLGFKAHFHGASLDADLMPLLVFPGGYGGMVATDSGRVSLSCCVRRDRLARIRAEHPGLRAGEAVLAHIRATTAGVRSALAGAGLNGPVLGAGPIRPGFRPLAEGGVFRIGNAAGEAHPVVAEGISMAIQSAALLFAALDTRASALRRPATAADFAAALNAAGRVYAAGWRSAFALRIRASAAIAWIALHAPLDGAMRTVVRLFPRALTAGAWLSGKVSPLPVRRPCVGGERGQG